MAAAHPKGWEQKPAYRRAGPRLELARFSGMWRRLSTCMTRKSSSPIMGSQSPCCRESLQTAIRSLGESLKELLKGSRIICEWAAPARHPRIGLDGFRRS